MSPDQASHQSTPAYTEVPSAPVEATLDWDAYRSHLHTLGAHEIRLVQIDRTATRTLEEGHARLTVACERLDSQLGHQLTSLEDAADPAGRTTAAVLGGDGLSGLREALRERSDDPVQALPSRLAEDAHIDERAVAGPVAAAITNVQHAADALRAARAREQFEADHAAWRRHRRAQLAKDVVVLPVTFGLGSLFLIALFWVADPTGPFNALIWTTIVSATAGGVVAAAGSWVFSQLAAPSAGKGSRRGFAEAAYLM